MGSFIALCALASAILYVIFGGADYGAGVLEWIDKSKKHRVTRAMAPVWEANHMWLILLVVIAFVAYPQIYTTVSIALHIPVLLVLIGIIVRGCAFTFRHYDRSPDKKEDEVHRVYDWAFRFSSLWVPFFLGVVAASMTAGRVRVSEPTEFYLFFVAPWLHVYAFAAGIFVIALFAFGASLLLATESPKELKTSLSTCRRLHGLTVALGVVVFFAAQIDGVPLFERFTESAASIASLVVATALIPVIAWAYDNVRLLAIRSAMCAQIAAVVIGFVGAQEGVAIRVADGADITLRMAQAPEPTLMTLTAALAFGLLVILPSLGMLFWVFKRPGAAEPS